MVKSMLSSLIFVGLCILFVAGSSFGLAVLFRKQHKEEIKKLKEELNNDRL